MSNSKTCRRNHTYFYGCIVAILSLLFINIELDFRPHALSVIDRTDRNSEAQRTYKLPEVLLLGVQKAGSSALAEWFYHEGFRRALVFEGEPYYFAKEPHFFNEDTRYEQGIEFYVKRFQYNDTTHPALDATPNTLGYPDRVRATYEQAGSNQVNTVKFIVILRDPHDRELSLYNHMVQECRSDTENCASNWFGAVLKSDGSIRTFDEFVERYTIPLAKAKPARYDALYSERLKSWFHYFRRDQILILSYDEYKRDTEMVLHRIRSFLGRDMPSKRVQETNTHSSQSKVKEMSKKARAKLTSFFKPYNEELYQLLEDHPGPPSEERPFPRFNSG